MNIKRILQNDFSILMSKSNEGKTMFLVNLIKEYKENFEGNVFAYGLGELSKKLNVNEFNSIAELENIRDSIIIIDEIGRLFDLSNRKLRRQIENVFRLVNHNGNKIVASGLCSDYKKFLCAKAKCFIYKTHNITDLINGSLAKEIILQYQGHGKGIHSFQIPKDQVLIYDGSYYKEKFIYLKEYDTKLTNKDLFIKKNVRKLCKKGDKIGRKNV